MGKKGDKTVESVVDLVMSLWARADRDFVSIAARRAFRETCHALLQGDFVDVVEPPEGTSRDSSEWARYVAANDCRGVGELIAQVSRMVNRVFERRVIMKGYDDCESDDESSSAGWWELPTKRRKTPMLNPATDRRFKVNKSPEQLEKMHRNLEAARAVASENSDDSGGGASGDSRLPIPCDDSSSLTCEDEGVTYEKKRKSDSRPQKVPLPDLPRDYRIENEWIKENIKSPDMLYSYVRVKAGDGVRWSSGLKKYYDSSAFWEFAFDTLSSGGWNDSEHNRPISNVSKYITKCIIEEYSRHEATKHSRFEGKFKNGKELQEYLHLHCKGLNGEYTEEAYCEWFLQRMNDIGWRWNNGATINNLPAQLSKMHQEYKEWSESNSRNLIGLNPDQIGDTSRVYQAIENGKWKPRANGKFSALDLKGLI